MTATGSFKEGFVPGRGDASGFCYANTVDGETAAALFIENPTSARPIERCEIPTPDGEHTVPSIACSVDTSGDRVVYLKQSSSLGEELSTRLA